MAERHDSDGKTRGKDLKADEIMDRLIPDPAKGQAPLPRLVGLYLGNSSRPDYWRLYISHKLDRFLEFRKDDVLDAERPETGRVVVWLKSEAKVDLTTTEQLSEAFLRGEIQAQHLGQVSGLPDLRRTMALAMGSCTCPANGDKKETGFGGSTCPTDTCKDSLNKC